MPFANLTLPRQRVSTQHSTSIGQTEAGTGRHARNFGGARTRICYCSRRATRRSAIFSTCSSIGCTTISRPCCGWARRKSTSTPRFRRWRWPWRMPLGRLAFGPHRDELFLRAARSGLVIVGMTASAGLLLAGTLATEPLWIVTWLSLALGVLGMAEGPFWVTAVEVGGSRGGLSAGHFQHRRQRRAASWRRSLTPWVSDTLGFGWQAGIPLGSVVCLAGARCGAGSIELGTHARSAARHLRTLSEPQHTGRTSRRTTLAMKITKIDCHVLLIPDYDAAGLLVGAGRLGRRNPHRRRPGRHRRDRHQSLGRPRVHSGPRHALHGTGPGRNVDRRRSARSGGTVAEAVQRLEDDRSPRRADLRLGAIDMALWDIRGKAAGQPIYKLLGGSANEPVVPYASLLATGDTVAAQCESLVEKCRRGAGAGLSGRQARSLHQRTVQPQRLAGRRIGRGRDRGRLSPGRGKRFHADGRRGLCLAKRPNMRWRVLEQLGAVTTCSLSKRRSTSTIWKAMRSLAEHSPIRIAAGEWQNTHWEFLGSGRPRPARRAAARRRPRGRIHRGPQGVPDRRRARSADRAALLEKRRSASPPAPIWRPRRSVCPYIEFLPAELSESPLRRELVADELPVVDGTLRLREKPGLGIELNRDALARFAE